MIEGERLGRWEGEIKPERISDDRFWNAEVGMRKWERKQSGKK